MVATVPSRDPDGIRRLDLLPVGNGKGGEGGQVLLGLQQHLFNLGKLLPEHVGHRIEVVIDGFGGGLDEDGADGRRDHFPGPLRYRPSTPEAAAK